MYRQKPTRVNAYHDCFSGKSAKGKLEQIKICLDAESQDLCLTQFPAGFSVLVFDTEKNKRTKSVANLLSASLFFPSVSTIHFDFPFPLFSRRFANGFNGRIRKTGSDFYSQ